VMIGTDGTVTGKPSADLVEAAFGVRPFSGNAGLWSSGTVGEQIFSEDRVTIVPFLDLANERVLGGTFHLRGFRFFLYLDEEGFKATVNFQNKDGTVTQHKPIRHIQAIKFTVGPSQKRLSHIVLFKW